MEQTKLMKRLTDLKKIDPDLKVFIAVGGWAFNDPGTTQTLFSDLAASTSNQKNWEYPVADDRGGSKEDFDNFPKFLSNLKSSLKTTGGRDGLSITLPASYWYLQHFDIANLQKHADFFNIMTYDIHGKWDLGNEWLDPVLDSHTNLTEITNALDLLWRNDIDSDKVVLGIAFYARVFAVADTSCMEPDCLFASGGNPGPCSHEVGILLNSEIMDIMDEQSLESELDKDAAVKILKFDDTQWLTYDNGDTFKLKADFARSQCLGGVMVWAVSHDLPHGNFSLALGDAVDRQVKSLLNSGQAESMEVQKTNQQCKWTNCEKDCPSGWSRVPRSDDGARTGEHMWDLSACSFGQHTFCCPPDADLPKCGWYTHNNGKCNSQCPTDYVKWTDCEWYDNIGFALADDYVDDYCYPSCPDDKVRVAIDQHGGGCKGSGGRAKCCTPKYITKSKRSYTSEQEDMDDLVKSFMEDPTCDLDYEFKRDLDGINFLPLGNTSMSRDSASSMMLARRSASKELSATETILFTLVMTYVSNAVYNEIWKTRVVSVYKNLAVATIRAYLETDRDSVDRGSAVILDDIICDIALYNGILGDIDHVSCECDTDDCCDSTDSCTDEDVDDDDDAYAKRDLEKRVARTRDFDVDLQDGGQDVVVTSWTVRMLKPPKPC
ncbi:CAZyme family GH18 [Penicillium herquei]|nr:CAZyme family GH18 [Penicillium herquei]